jgi:hypothetical protein
LFGRLGLPDVETPTSMEPERVGQNRPYYAEQEAIAVRRLGFAIDALGYSTQPDRTFDTN